MQATTTIRTDYCCQDCWLTVVVEAHKRGSSWEDLEVTKCEAVKLANNKPFHPEEEIKAELYWLEFARDVVGGNMIHRFACNSAIESRYQMEVAGLV